MINAITNKNKLTEQTLLKSPHSRPAFSSNLKADTISFSGIMDPQKTSLFVFDLDGSFADLGEDEKLAKKFYGDNYTNFLNENIKAFYKYKKEKNAKIVYASARTAEDFGKLRDKLAKKGVNLPVPDYYAGNNGNFLYRNEDGKLVKDETYSLNLQAKTNFCRKEVYEAIKEISQRSEYRLSEDQIAKHPELAKFKEESGDFYNSKMAYYEFCPSDLFLEYMYTADVHNRVEQDVKDALERRGMKCGFNFNKYPKSNIDWIASMAKDDKKFADIILKSRPLRVDNDGGLYTVHISAAKKSDAVEYLMKKLEVSPEEVIAGGNDVNDISLAEMTRNGSWFIAVGNASKEFQARLEKIASDLYAKGWDNYQKLVQEAAEFGNESIRRGMNIIATVIKEKKEKQYASIIENVKKSTPQTEIEHKVSERYNSGEMKEKVEELTIRNAQGAPDEYPEAFVMQESRRRAENQVLIEIIEALT